MMQVEYRERLVELAEGLVVAEKLLTQGDEEQPPVQAGG
jgi:hypothetical protein